jgi:hypothetical protein
MKEAFQKYLSRDPFPLIMYAFLQIVGEVIMKNVNGETVDPCGQTAQQTDLQ